MNLSIFSRTAGMYEYTKSQAYKKCYSRQNSGEIFGVTQVPGTTVILHLALTIMTGPLTRTKHKHMHV